MDVREIVGRDDELAAVTDFLSAAEPASALLLEGEAGIGKTTLWSAGVRHARSSGFRVLVASPAGAESQLAFAGLGDLLGEVFADVEAELPQPQRRALAVALLREDADGTPPEPRAVAVAFLEALRRASSTDPILIAVDDLQWLDSPSGSALEFAARRLDGPVLLLVTRRVEAEDEPVPLALDRSLGERLRVVPVGPLSLGALHRMLQDQLGTSFPRPVLRRLHETAGGNPFYGIELARALARVGGHVDPAAPLPVPGTLRELIRDRLGALSERARETLAIAATLPEPTLEILERGFGSEVAENVHEAEDSQVVTVDDGRIRFAHPLLASVVPETADRKRVRAAHRRLAATLADLELRARHLALAAEGHDEAVALALEEAARDAVARGRPAAAAELLERARALTRPDDPAAWARRSNEAGHAHAEAGDEARSQALWAEVVRTAPPGPERARALGWIAWYRTQGTSEIDQARAEAGDDLALRAWLDFVAVFIAMMQGSYLDSLDAAREAVSGAETAGDTNVLVQALSLLGHLETLVGTGEPLVHFARAEQLEPAAGRIPSFFSPASFIGRYHLLCGELELARRYLKVADERATHAGDEESHAQLLVFRSEVECRAGALRTARELAQELIDFMDQGGPDLVGTQVLHLPRAIADAHLGDVDSARGEVEAGLADAVAGGWKFWEGKLRSGLAFIEVAAGDYDAALRWLEPIHALEAEVGLGDPGIWMFAGNELEALIAVGRIEEAEEKLVAFEQRGRELDRPWILATAARCQGLLLSSKGDYSGALASFDDALRAHERLPMPFERARTLVALGQVQRRAKHRREARESLDQAIAMFEELGARPWAEKAQAELARIGGRTPARGLTATERRIAELVAEGRSNKEVAAALFVTVKAVEANLTRIYAKLGIRSRAALARHVADAGKE